MEVGDKVEVIKQPLLLDPSVGSKGIIKRFDGEDYTVAFETWKGGWGEESEHWFCSPEMLGVIE